MKPGDKFILTNSLPGVEPLPVLFRHVQPGFLHIPEKRMFDILAVFGKYPIETTLSETTLENAGFVIPK